MPNSPTATEPGKDKVQADNLLSQPDPDTEAVAEEVSLDQQSGDARRVGQLPKEAEQALGESLKNDKPAPH